MRLTALLIAVLLSSTLLAAEAAKPNVIVILADDYGWGSLGCMGAPDGLKTPNLDRLAKEGRRFTNAYATGSVCSPTRYAMMTGRYYWRSSIKDGEVLPGNAPLHFETTRLCLGSLFKAQGYATAAVGKWHLGLGMSGQTDWNKPLTPGPLQVGFDYFYGLAANVGNHPNAYIENESLVGRDPSKLVAVEGKGKDGQTTVGITEQRVEDQVMGRLTARVTKWIEEHAAQPFFVYYAPNAIHEPITPSARFKGTSKFGVYGDFIQELDDSVGQVLAVLDKHKLAENTIVLFTSDNGGVANPNNAHSAEAIKLGLPVNGNLKGGKHDIWEGGFREPYLVRWPGRIPAGSVCDDIVSISDTLATLASITGGSLKDAEDSLDVSAAWLGKGPSPRKSIVLQDARAHYAIREGNWKLVEWVGGPHFEPRNKAVAKKLENFKKNEPKANQLYDLAADPSETKNVAAEHPDVVARLQKMLNEARAADHTR